jgi:hypothetical protein
MCKDCEHLMTENEVLFVAMASMGLVCSGLLILYGKVLAVLVAGSFGPQGGLV